MINLFNGPRYNTVFGAYFKIMENCWKYSEKCLEEVPEGYFGFLYSITADNKIYYGKKQFNFSKKTKLSKKVRLASDNKRKRIAHKITESDWKEYYGSCKPLLEWIKENGTDSVQREVIMFCKTKIDLTYYEALLLMSENVLFRDDCWNTCILNKFWKGRVSKLDDVNVEDDGF